MSGGFFHTVFYEPLYNALIFLLHYAPGGSVGLAVITLTLLVKFILLPLSAKAAVTQLRMREVEPELKVVNEKYKDDWQKRAAETSALYKKYNIKPFSSILLIFIQFPIVIALYAVFFKGGLPSVHLADLYTFVTPPEQISTIFLGFFELTKRSILLAVLAAGAQFIQTSIVLPATPDTKDLSFKGEFTRAMHFQMRFVLPIIVGFVAYAASSVVALYLLVGSLFAALQDFLIKRSLKTSGSN